MNVAPLTLDPSRLANPARAFSIREGRPRTIVGASGIQNELVQVPLRRRDVGGSGR